MFTIQQSQNRSEFLPDEGFSEDQYNLQQPQEQQYEAQPPSSLPPTSQIQPEEPQEEPFDMQKWSEDYKSLANAVYNADADQSGELVFFMGSRVEDLRLMASSSSSWDL